MTVTLAQLVTPITEADAVAAELAFAQSLGLPTTAWQPLGMARTILAINANIIQAYSQDNALLAQGAYASTAALMVDANGNPITTWMDLRAQDQYNVTRIPAASAAGNVPLVNGAAAAPTWSPNSPLHFQHPTSGATYTTTGSGTVAGNATTQVAIQADAAWAGAIGTAASGTTLILLTPLTNVTVGALASSLVGTNAETNAHLLARCVAKLGSLSPNGAAGAYLSEVEGLPFSGSVLPDGTTWAAPTAAFPWGVTAPVTRAIEILNIATGIVNVYVANAGGALVGSAQNPITNVTHTGSAPNYVATVTTANPTGLAVSATCFVEIAGVGGATLANNSLGGTVAWVATGVGANSFSFPVVSPFSFPAYTSGGIAVIGDLGMCDAAIQANVVPNGQTAIVASAASLTVAVTGTIYLSKAAGITAAAAQSYAATAINNYFATVPIGGVNAETSGILPLSGLVDAIFRANNGTASVVLTLPASDTSLSPNLVPVAGTITLTVVLV